MLAWVMYPVLFEMSCLWRHHFIDRASLSGHFMNPSDPFGSFKLEPARHFSCEKKPKLGMFWCIPSSGDLVSCIVFQLEVNAKCYLTFATCHASLCSKIIWDHAAMKLRTRSVLFKTSIVSKCPIRTWWCERRCLQARSLLIDKLGWCPQTSMSRSMVCLIAQLVSSHHPFLSL